MVNKNLSFSLTETPKTKKSSVTYESLIEQVNEKSNELEYINTDELSIDDYVASEIDYNENYTKTIRIYSRLLQYFKKRKKKSKN